MQQQQALFGSSPCIMHAYIYIYMCMHALLRRNQGGGMGSVRGREFNPLPLHARDGSDEVIRGVKER